MANLVLIMSCLAILSAMRGMEAVQYTVTNNAASTAGGARFMRDIGAQYTLQTMNASTGFIWRSFQQNTATDRKNVQKVGLFIDDMDGVAYASNDQIHVSARYIQGYGGDVKREFSGVLYHEMTHVWQWNGNGQAPGGLIEGIADYVRLKAGYAPSHWVKAGQGDRWDQGYDVTARFLDYCNGLRNGFVAQLNKKMRGGYSNNYFVELLGKTVDQLWRDYKAMQQHQHKYFPAMFIDEMTHMFRWHGNFRVPGVWLRGRRLWCDREVLEFCDSLVKDFTANLNTKISPTLMDSNLQVKL